MLKFFQTKNKNANPPEALFKFKPAAWLPSEFIINFVREEIVASCTKKNCLLVEHVIQGIEHHSDNKVDLCFNCALTHLTISENTDSLFLPYVNKNNGLPAHYRFIQIELKAKHIILWDPFGIEGRYTDLALVQEKIKSVPLFSDFTSQILTQKAQNDGYSCGDWVMQCYAWSIGYDFCNKSPAEIDESHRQYMQRLLSYLQRHKKIVRDLTKTFVENHHTDLCPAVIAPELPLTPPSNAAFSHLPVERGRDYFYTFMSRSQQIECIQLMIEKERDYHYLFDTKDAHHCKRMQQFITQEENRSCFIKILHLLNVNFAKEIATAVNLGFEEPLIPIDLFSISSPEKHTAFLLQKIQHATSYAEALPDVIELFAIFKEEDIPIGLALIFKLTTRFTLAHLTIFYDIAKPLQEKFEKDPQKILLFCSIIKSAILESLNQTANFEHFFMRFLGVSEAVFIQLDPLCEELRHHPEQTYLIDYDLDISIFQLQLFDTAADDAALYFLLTHFLTALFDLEQSYLLKKMLAALIISGCQQLIKDSVAQQKALRFAECLLKALLLTDKVPRVLQQDIFVSVLMVFHVRGFIPPLNILLCVTTDKHFCLDSKAIGFGMLEFCGRAKKTLLQFFEAFIQRFSVLQWELLTDAVLQALAENPFFFEHHNLFSPSLESYLFNVSQQEKNLYDLIDINFKKENSCFYLRLIIRSLPTIGAPDDFSELSTSLIIILDKLLLKSHASPLLAFNYILLLNKTKNSHDAFRLLNLLKSFNHWLNLFTESLQAQAQAQAQAHSRSFASRSIAHRYCLIIESCRDFTSILYSINRSDDGNQLLLQILNEDYYPENDFESYSRKDRRIIIEKLSLVFQFFSSEQLASFIEFLKDKPLSTLLPKILLSYLLKNIQKHNSNRAKQNLLDFLQFLWKAVDPKEDYHENIIKTLQHLKIINVTDYHSHALIANVLKYMTSELNTTLKATPEAPRAVYYRHLLTTFIAFLNENYNNPTMISQLREHYTTFYTDMRLTNLNIFQSVANESDTRRHLAALFFSNRAGLCNTISESKGHNTMPVLKSALSFK